MAKLAALDRDFVLFNLCSSISTGKTRYEALTKVQRFLFENFGATNFH